MRLRWRLYERHFNGPGAYTLTIGDRTLVISVDADRIFEATEKDQEGFPFYGFAAIVGSDRDVVAPTGLGSDLRGKPNRLRRKIGFALRLPHVASIRATDPTRRS